MSGRYNALRESGLAMQEIIEESCKRESEQKNKLLRELNHISSEREELKENARFKKDMRRKYNEKVYTEMLSTSLKGIYITALENHMFMDDRTHAIAENMVDKFIEEQGGAKVLLSKMEGKTYLLDTVRNIVIEAAEEAIEKSSDDDVELDHIDDESKEKLFDKLEKEEDIDTAVELISDRISTAEEEFIKKNKEDKEKIENIVNDINDRIKAVKKNNNMDDETKEEIQEECAIAQRKRIKEVYGNRQHTVFEQMVHSLSKSVLKDSELKPLYTTESGKLNIEGIVDSTKCLYGFLEFVNTTQLIKVDETYVEKILKEM